MALNIVSPGPLTTVQDFGRHGHQAEGYPECGACDKYALALANLLCGNGECPHMAGLEYTLAGPTLRADDYTLVALTGAVSHISLGAQLFPLPMAIVVASCLLGAVVSAKFANRCEIRRLNRIVGVVLILLGAVTILIKLL